MKEHDEVDARDAISRIESMMSELGADKHDPLEQSQRESIERKMVALEMSLDLLNDQLKRMMYPSTKKIVDMLGDQNLTNAKEFKHNPKRQQTQLRF